MRESARAFAMAAMTASAADGRRSNEFNWKGSSKEKGKGWDNIHLSRQSVGQSVMLLWTLSPTWRPGKTKARSASDRQGPRKYQSLSLQRVSGAGPHAAKSCDGNVSSLTLLGDEVCATAFLRHRVQR